MVAQLQAGIGLPGVDEPADLTQAGGAVAFGEQAEPAADVDRCELGRVADQQQLPADPTCLLDQFDQVGGGDHGRLVDQHQRAVR